MPNIGHNSQAIIWTNADLIHWCIYVALGGDELIDWPPGGCGGNFKSVIPQHMLQIKFMNIPAEILPLRWMPQNAFDDKSTLIQVNGLVPSGTKSLPEPMLTQFYVAMWH